MAAERLDPLLQETNTSTQASFTGSRQTQGHRLAAAAHRDTAGFTGREGEFTPGPTHGLEAPLLRATLPASRHAGEGEEGMEVANVGGAGGCEGENWGG